MGPLQNELIPHQHRTAVASWFRIPLKLIACVFLIFLHSDDNDHGTRKLFMGCSVLMFLAILTSITLRKTIRKMEPSAEAEALIENTTI
jgi:hypothetical protein